MKIPEYNDNEESPFCDTPMASSLPAGCKLYSRINYSKQIIEAYQGQDEDADKYIKKVKAIIGNKGPLELERVRQAMVEIKCPKNLDISLFY